MSVTASVLRERLRADSKRTSGLSEAALHTIREGARGQVHPDAIAAYNKGRKPAQRYVKGATGAARAEAKAAAAALREQAVKAGVQVGKRGPLPKAFLASLKG